MRGPDVRHRAVRPLGLLLLAALCALAVGVPLASGAHPSLSGLKSRIEAARGRLSGRHAHAAVLTSQLAGFNRRIGALQGHITSLEGRLNGLQADLAAKQARLARTHAQLRTTRARLARLRARFGFARRALARRLVELYESDQPDLITVVLDSHGFADMIQSAAFLRRIGAQDRRIITAVREAKGATESSARTLARLEAGRRAIAGAVRARRDAVASVRDELVTQRQGYSRQRDARAAALRTVRRGEADLRQHIDFLEGEQQQIQQRIQAASGPPTAGPVQGSGTLVWPVSGPITSPFCERRAWEACHPGIDIGVPTGTPIHAAAAGRVIIAGAESGYGNYTCIQHAGPLSTCYGHQSRIDVGVGQQVAQGQVIGLSGCTGLCSGPHLHFEVRVNGAVVDPMSYLG